MARVLFVTGYPIAVAILARWVPVVRERRWRWFLAHQVAVVAIVAGWLLLGRRLSAAVNGAWLAVAAGWYAREARGATGLAPRGHGRKDGGTDPTRPNDKESPDDRHG